MKRTPKAQGEVAKSISIGENSEFVAASHNVLNVKDIRANRDVTIVKDPVFIVSQFQSASQNSLPPLLIISNGK